MSITAERIREALAQYRSAEFTPARDVAYRQLQAIVEAVKAEQNGKAER